MLARGRLKKRMHLDPTRSRHPFNKQKFPLTAALNINQSSSPKCVPILTLAINRNATAINVITKKAIFVPMSQGCRLSSPCACMYAIWSGEGCFMRAVESAYLLGYGRVARSQLVESYTAERTCSGIR
jgi:hypothetical protein